MPPRSGWRYAPPPHVDLRHHEWLPIAEAAHATGYSGRNVHFLAVSGTIPTEQRPRPPWRPRSGPGMLMFVHVPSLRSHRQANDWQRGGPRRAFEKPPATKLGTFLRRKRLSMGMSQPAVSRLIGVTNNEISYWELGRKCPNFQNIVRLADLYNMSLPERWAMVEAIAWAHGARHLEGDDEQ